MPPSVVQHAATNYTASPNSTAFPSNITAGNLLLVACWRDPNDAATTLATLSDTRGNTWAQASYRSMTGVGVAEIYWAFANASGANTVSTGSTGNTYSLGTYIYEVSGVSAVDVTATPTANSSNSAISPPSLIGLISSTDFVLYFANYNTANATGASGTGWTSDNSVTLTGSHYTCLAYAITGTAVTPPTFLGGANAGAWQCLATSFKPAATVTSVDLFADYYKWTVSAGATTAPAAGTTETWTVASSAGAPAAATGVSQFRVVDLADTNTPPEIMIVTNVSGTTWRATRGGEGAAPWAHTSGWTAVPVLTAGGLANGSGPQSIIVGTTAGTVTVGQPLAGMAYKKVVAYANGYRNSTATAQTYTYPTPFANTPAVISDGITGVSSTATTLSLPVSMSGTQSGTIIVEGF